MSLPGCTWVDIRDSNHEDSVPDQIWEEAWCHDEERALATLLLAIATTNI